MSYEEPASWTDVDAGGNAISWASMTNKLIYPAVEMIRRAIDERTLGGSTSLSELEPGGSLIPTGWMYAVEQEIDALVPLFVDHTQVGGSDAFEDVSIIPMWTIANLMTAISETRITHTDTGHQIPLAAWAVQQYKMLNMLRWRRYWDTIIDLKENTEEIKVVENVTTWGTVESSFPGQSWNAVETEDGALFAMAWAQAADDFSAQRERVTAQYKQTSHGFDVALDIYVRPENHALIDNWECNDFGSPSEANLGLDFQVTTPAEYDSNPTDIGVVADYDTVPVAEPAEGENAGYRLGEMDAGLNENAAGLIVVAKFDVAGGFVWKDW